MEQSYRLIHLHKVKKNLSKVRCNMYSFVRWSVIFDLLIVDGVDIYCNLFEVRFKGECGVELHILQLVNIAF